MSFRWRRLKVQEELICTTYGLEEALMVWPRCAKKEAWRVGQKYIIYRYLCFVENLPEHAVGRRRPWRSSGTNLNETKEMFNSALPNRTDLHERMI